MLGPLSIEFKWRESVILYVLFITFLFMSCGPGFNLVCDRRQDLGRESWFVIETSLFKSSGPHMAESILGLYVL